MSSWRPEVLVEGEWVGNGQRFSTREEAEGSARDLFSRWLLTEGHRATESSDPVNYERRDGRDRRIER